MFRSKCFFGEAEFSSIADFSNTEFNDHAKFIEVQFLGNSIFDSSQFSKSAQFEKTRMRCNASFSEACFGGDAHFDEVIFDGEVRFYLARFLESAFFTKAAFSGRFNFEAARFARALVFTEVTFPTQEALWRRAFSGALLEFIFDARSNDPRAMSAFSGVTLSRGIMLTRFGESEENRIHSQALDLALANEDKQDALLALEGGALKLKLAMERDSDKLREQRFYRLELRARRRQKGTPWAEKLFSSIYSAIANYGGSISRPLIALFAMIGLFALIFVAWDFARHPADILRDPSGAVWQALDFSWSNVFKPFSLSSAQGALSSQNPLESRLLQQGTDGLAFLFRIVLTAQSVFAVILAFLVALAVRRRFQIS